MTMAKNSSMRDPFSDSVPSVGMDDQIDSGAGIKSKRGMTDRLRSAPHQHDDGGGKNIDRVARGTYPQGKRADL